MQKTILSFCLKHYAENENFETVNYFETITQSTNISKLFRNNETQETLSCDNFSIVALGLVDLELHHLLDNLGAIIRRRVVELEAAHIGWSRVLSAVFAL